MAGEAGPAAWRGSTSLSVCTSYFCFRRWRLTPSRLRGVNLSSQRRSQPSHTPPRHRLFMYQIYFLLPRPPRIHTAFITGGVMKTEFMWQSPTCIVRLGCGVKVSSLRLSRLHTHRHTHTERETDAHTFRVKKCGER